MSFVVVMRQERWRRKTRRGEHVACMFPNKAVRRVFKEEFATQGGAETFRDLVAKQLSFAHERLIPGSLRLFVMPIHNVDAYMASAG